MTRVRFKQWDCIVRKREYGNGRPALELVDAEDGSPIAKATVNLPDVPLETVAICCDLERHVFNLEHTDPKVAEALRATHWYDLREWTTSGPGSSAQG